MRTATDEKEFMLDYFWCRCGDTVMESDQDFDTMLLGDYHCTPNI